MRLATIVACTVLLLPHLANADPLPAGAKALSATDVKSLYGGKTLAVSSTNLMYFAADGKFSGVQENGNGVSTSGTWAASANGRLCYDAMFASAGDLVLKAAATHMAQCWDHQLAKDGTIYRRDAGEGVKYQADNLAMGDWAVFKSAAANPADPVNQLAASDGVSPKVQAIMAALTTSPGDRPDLGQQLKGAAIQASLFGHVMKSAVVPGLPAGAVRRISVDAKGVSFIETTSSLGKSTITGTSRVAGDYLCLHVPMNQPEKCFFVYKSGDNQYALVFPDLGPNSNFVVE